MFLCTGFVVFVTLIVTQVSTVDIICHFNGYNADCRYRLDGSSLVNIKVTVNKCHDPIDVTFDIISERPKVEWSHVFSNNHEITKVEGFLVQLEVNLSFDDKDDLYVKADFIDENKKSYFLDEPVHITGLEDCFTINKAGQIAVGCLIALLLIAGVLLVVLLYYRHRRRQIERQNQVLVDNIESSCDQDCAGCQPTVRFDAQPAGNQSSTNQISSSSSHVTFVLSNGNAEGSSTSLPI